MGPSNFFPWNAKYNLGLRSNPRQNYRIYAMKWDLEKPYSNCMCLEMDD